MLLEKRIVIPFFVILIILIALQVREYGFKHGIPSHPIPARYVIPPECENLLENITNGRWVRKRDLAKNKEQWEALIGQEEEMAAELMDFWLKRGIPETSWREDFRCGYKNLQVRPPGSTWPRVGSWCDPKGERPCCSNDRNGTCMAPSNATCSCDGRLALSVFCYPLNIKHHPVDILAAPLRQPAVGNYVYSNRRCVDLRKYVFAETSEWTVADNRCKWKDYDAGQVCDVIERSRFHDIHYVGDSFTRKMFKALAIMITNDFDYGAIGASTPSSIAKSCKKMQQFFWTFCRSILSDISETMYPKNLCGGRGYMNFSVQSHEYPGAADRSQFLKLVESKLNVSGSLIVLSIGYHMRCQAQIVIDQYLGPAIEAINKQYGPPLDHVHSTNLSQRWPTILLCFPPTISLLKPPVHMGMQSPARCDKYIADMKVYADKNDISVFDFRAISKNVHSFDGSHYGFGVNRLKNLILLNFIESLK